MILLSTLSTGHNDTGEIYKFCGFKTYEKGFIQNLKFENRILLHTIPITFFTFYI